MTGNSFFGDYAESPEAHLISKTLNDCEALRAEAERLRAEVLRALDEPTQNEHDLYAENERLRVKLELLRECCRPGVEDAPDGPATFLRAARKILSRT